MIARAAIAFALAACPAQAQQTPYDGDWATGDPARCVVGFGDDANMAWRFRDGEIIGIESGCRMSNPVAVCDMNATLYDLECSGEGEEWRARAFLMIDHADRLIFVREGLASVLPRCTAIVDPFVAPAPTKGE